MYPKHIIFTKRAFNAIVTETIDKNPLETGGIFIGYILDNGIWVVIETIPPGIETKNQKAYFEYDAKFITYLSNVIAKQYKGNLQKLGLWHRHPGSMDIFSRTDDETNVMFAKECAYGALSALVNCDPQFRLTMYHVNEKCHYTKIKWSIDDNLIPNNLLALHFENDINLPILGKHNTPSSVTSEYTASYTLDETEPTEEHSTTEELAEQDANSSSYSFNDVINDIGVIAKKIFK